MLLTSFQDSTTSVLAKSSRPWPQPLPTHMPPLADVQAVEQQPESTDAMIEGSLTQPEGWQL